MLEKIFYLHEREKTSKEGGPLMGGKDKRVAVGALPLHSFPGAGQGRAGKDLG